MTYAKIENQNITTYPYSITQLRMDNPNTSFPLNPKEEDLRDFGVVYIQPVEKPVVDYTQTVVEATPQQLGGTWTQVWQVLPASAEEIAERVDLQANIVRATRNNLLSQSDWTQVADAPVDKAAWAVYRQQLRDVTAQQGFPFSVVWPVQPV